jgi:hypothetical protein
MLVLWPPRYNVGEKLFTIPALIDYGEIVLLTAAPLHEGECNQCL